MERNDEWRFMKVSVPKKDIEEIANRFGCSQEQAYHAYLEARSNFDATLENLLNSKNKSPDANQRS